jgi:hypothetical protein
MSDKEREYWRAHPKEMRIDEIILHPHPTEDE